MKNSISFFLASCFFSTALFAQSGSLDSSFGVNGIVATDIGASSFDLLHNIIIQPDQKILAVGSSNSATSDFAVIRYLADGTPDPDFGVNGIAIINFGGYDVGHAVAVLPDGKLIVAGESQIGGSYDFALTRLYPDGTIDSTFGVNALVITDLGGDYEFATSLAIQEDGKIIAAGKIVNGSVVTADFGMVRYSADGIIDSGFGMDGKVRTSVRDEDEATGIILQSDGKIVLGGFAAVNAIADFAMVRYLDNGEIDKSFGIGGKTITDVEGTGRSDFESCMMQDKDGYILLAGSPNYEPFFGEADMGMVRYDRDGHIDPNFGIQGVYILDIGTNSQMEAIAQQPDGKYLMAGKSDVISFKNQWIIARIRNEGGLDTLFGDHGIVVTDMPGNNETVQSIAIQQDSRIVAGGVGGSASIDFTLARYIADFIMTANVSGVTCPGQTNGQIVMTVSGGVEPYSYSLDGIIFQDSPVFNDLAPGVYNVTVHDSNGNGVTATFGPIQINDVMAPPVEVDVTGNIITVTVDGGVAPFQYSVTGGVVFQAGNIFPGLSDGAYTVVVVDGNGCIIYNDVAIVQATGIHDLAEISFSISPNPCREFISIEMESKAQDVSGIIVDMNGRWIRNELITLGANGKFTLNVNQLANGSYTLWLQDGERWGSASFVVSRN